MDARGEHVSVYTSRHPAYTEIQTSESDCYTSEGAEVSGITEEEISRYFIDIFFQLLPLKTCICVPGDC